MKAEIINVGSELLLGQIANINAQIISEELQKIGVNVYYHTCVGDNEDRLNDVFKTAFERSDVIILTGGLGPTEDDITKETVSSYLGIPLITDYDSLDRIKSYFASRNRNMSENNLKQAEIPKGSVAITNHYGTAPGIFLKHKGRIIVMLPGPPLEMKPMLKDVINSYLTDFSDSTIYSRVMRFYGIGESQLEEKLKDLILTQSNPTIATLAKTGEVIVRLTAKAENNEKAKRLIKPVEEQIKKRLHKFLYAYGSDTIEEVVAKLLMQSSKTIAVAESCTGGLISNKLTNVSGISHVFDRGIISYSNKSKMDLLGVKSLTLKEYGAVSEQTAQEMAIGVKNLANSDIGISVTGIAGPSGATSEKPVGLVYIGYVDANKIYVKKCVFSGNRLKIKECAANAALHLIRIMFQR